MASAPLIAKIDPDACIGCTKCIAACPVDAIVGAQDRHHGIIEAECIGCKLCIPPCPVDCIDMLPQPPLDKPSRLAFAQLAKTRVKARKQRLKQQHDTAKSRFQSAKSAASTDAIAAALARSKKLKAGKHDT